jgi:hypothetical protein
MPNTIVSNAKNCHRDRCRLCKDGETIGSFFFVANSDGYKIEIIQKGGGELSSPIRSRDSKRPLVVADVERSRPISSPGSAVRLER